MTPKKDLDKYGFWADNLKVYFYPGLSKQGQEVIFSRKINKIYHPASLYINSAVEQIPTQEHLGIHLNEELTFKHYINEKINKANRVLELFVN